MLNLLNIILYKYSKKVLVMSKTKSTFIYKRNKEYFRLILKNIIMFYKNIINPFFLNSFLVYRLPNTFVTKSIFREELFLKNFYC